MQTTVPGNGEGLSTSRICFRATKLAVMCVGQTGGWRGTGGWNEAAATSQRRPIPEAGIEKKRKRYGNEVTEADWR